MNLRDLHYVLAVAEHRHFGKAAEASFVTQPTLSGQIKKLKEKLGVTIFERTNRSEATPVGEQLPGRGLGRGGFWMRAGLCVCQPSKGIADARAPKAPPPRELSDATSDNVA